MQILMILKFQKVVCVKRITMPQKKTGLHTAFLKLRKTALIQRNSINKKTELIYMKKSLNRRQAELSSSITLKMA